MSSETASRGCSSCPASYVIKVRGRLDESWSTRMAGLHIEVSSEGGGAVSTLDGSLPDQPALLGVLNALCSLGLPLLSVRLVDLP